MENSNSNSSKRLKALELIHSLKVVPLDVIIFEILPFLTAREISSLCSTSKYFKEICNVGDRYHSILWTALFRSDLWLENFKDDDYYASISDYIKSFDYMINKISVFAFNSKKTYNDWNGVKNIEYPGVLYFDLRYESAGEVFDMFNLNIPGFSGFRSTSKKDFINKSEMDDEVKLLFIAPRSRKNTLNKNDMLRIYEVDINFKEDKMVNFSSLSAKIIHKNDVFKLGVSEHEHKIHLEYFYFKKGFISDKVSVAIIRPEERIKQFKKLDFLDKVYNALKSKNISYDIGMELKPYSRIEAYDNVFISKDNISKDFIIVDKKTGNPFCFHKHNLSDITSHFEDEGKCFNKICPKCEY